ncbi:hypothetical protein TWF730_002322 [Orbilia blumenaviensis]|uniref:Uncharacterized protein n=1 Tax=Orbilia blumenaviensis TaxID=1796055 RepID=A0AAV9U9P9_9PEZI
MSILRACASLRTAVFRATRTTPFVGLSTSRIRQHIQPLPTKFWVSKSPKTQRMTLLTMNQSLIDRLKSEEVIPDVVDEFIPSVSIEAKFPSGEEIQLGNTLEEGATQDKPRVTVTPIAVSGQRSASQSKDTKYTLCLTDPDAASRDNPKWAEYCHWLVTNIQQASGILDFKSAKELIEYMGPAPPEKTGKHRYVLLLFENGKSEPQKIDGRKKWGFEDHEPRVGARHYARQYGLELVANYFLCQNKKQ